MAESSQRREKPILRARTKHARCKTVKYCKPVLDEIGKYLPHWARVDATAGTQQAGEEATEAPCLDLSGPGTCSRLGFANKLIFFFKPLGTPKGVLFTRFVSGTK